MSVTRGQSAMSIWKSLLRPARVHQMRRLLFCHHFNVPYIKHVCVDSQMRIRISNLSRSEYNEAYVLFQGHIVEHSIKIPGCGGIERVRYG